MEEDTVKLLRECDAGVKMGITSLEEVLDTVRDPALKRRLSDCKREHEALERELRGLLDRCGDDGKEPNPMARGMSWLKTQVKLGLDPSDAAVAGLITDGCGMGVKSLSQYLNQYPAADDASRDLARRLIRLEDRLAADLRVWL